MKVNNDFTGKILNCFFRSLTAKVSLEHIKLFMAE